MVVVESIGDEDIFEFAQKLFTARGIGRKGDDNGLLVLFVNDKRTVRFHTGYGLEGALPDVVCKRIQRDFMIPEFKNGNFNAGMQQVEKILTDRTYAEELKKPEGNEVSDWVGFVIFLSIVFVPVQKAGVTPYPEMLQKRGPWLLEHVGIPVLIVVLFGISRTEKPVGFCFITLYLYFMGTLFHRLWQMKKVLNRF